MPDLDRIEALLGSCVPGRGLPRPFYVDPMVFEFDLEAVFAKSWLIVGFACEVAAAGSYLAVTLGRWPVLVVRDLDGELRAYHNVCRHRGAQICPDGTGRVKRIVCPYHRWTYALTGELVHAGRMGPDLDFAELGLSRIHVACVGGAVYVCLAEAAPDILPFKCAFEPLIAAQNMGRAKLAASSLLLERANWKLVMENARECYHCPGSHPELSRSFPVQAKAYFDFGGDAHLADFEARMGAAGLPLGPVRGEFWDATRFPLNEGCVSMTLDGRPAVRRPMCEAADGDVGSLRWAIEPHSFCHAAGDHVFMFSALPIAVDQTLVVSKWLVHEEAVEGVDYDVEGLTALWTATNLQDRDLAENNQRGVLSPGYRPGPYSAEAESLLMNFADWYRRAARRHIEAHRRRGGLGAA